MCHYVLRLDVVMDQAACVHGLKPLQHLQSQCDHGLKLELPLLNLKKTFHVYVVFGHHNEIKILFGQIAVCQHLWVTCYIIFRPQLSPYLLLPQLS